MNQPNQTPPSAQSSGIPYVEVLFGPQKGKRFVMDGAEAVIGRSPDSSFVVDDPLVSRKHMTILETQQGLTVQDQGSVNGIRIQGARVNEAVLNEGDVIELGATVLILKFGEAPISSPAYPPANVGRTQRMPALRHQDPDGVPPQLPEADTEPEQPAQRPPMVRSWLRSPRSPWFIRIVSWVVVLVLALGGILLLLELIDTNKGVSLTPAPQLQDEKEDRTTERRRRVRIPAPDNVAGSLQDSPVDQTPDVALEQFQKGQALERDGDFAAAFKVYEQISERYPEFTPDGGQPIPEYMDRTARTLTFQQAVKHGRELLDSRSRDQQILEDAIRELAKIPTTNGLFGEKAIYLAEQLRSRVRQLEHGFLEEELEEPPAESDAPTVEDKKDDGDSPSDQTEPTTEAKISEASTPDPENDETIQARRKAAYLYGKNEFTRAVVVLQEAGRLTDSARTRQELKDLASAVQRFQKQYEEAITLADSAGQEQAAIVALEKTRKLDRRLFDAHGDVVKKKLVDLNCTLSKRAFDGGNYVDAREHLDQALAVDGASKEPAKLNTLYSFKANELLRRAQDTADVQDALDIVQRVKELTTKNDKVHQAATHLESELKNR